ncbi:MAG TPA: TonB family protein [Terriglobales bacterium]|jgi:protein TonB|nr:TonB family protein [Terriglobales bacterium]
MSYRALLFCPDETAARPVTQVLSELDFTVELSFEPFVTVKKLTDESFDAIVVDCGNEENATLLFKGARNSSLNHSSLCVAVVEGQMGVAKAFRIGANLVLTKPINLEQSKGTLRVARGLLRKGELNPRPTPGSAMPSPSTPPLSPVSAPKVTPATSETMAAGIAHAELAPGTSPAVSMPSSLFEAEQVKPRGHEQERSKPSEFPPAAFAGRQVTEPTPFPTGISAGAAAAPALAPERTIAQPPETHASRIKTASPLATQETIFPEKRFPEPMSAAVEVPAISSFPTSGPSSSRTGVKALWVIVALLVLGPAAYFGWQKLQPMRYLHRPVSATGSASAVSPAANPSADVSPVNTAPAQPQNNIGVTAPASTPDNSSNATNAAAPEGFPTKESIDVDQPIEAPEPKITVVPKPEPLQVNQEPAETNEQTAPPAPPSLVLPGSKASDAALAGIVSSNVMVPKPAPHALQVSEGVIQGLLIKKVAPAYPPVALQLRKQGDVHLLATVSKTGSITQMKVLSGESMLAKAAMDAVRQWKYRPFLLNAEPVEVQTQITIKFKLPN